MIRLLFLILISSLPLSFLQAQIVEKTLEINPVLEKIALEKAQQKEVQRAAFRKRYGLENANFRSDLIEEEIQYVVSGETIEFCIDTLGQTSAGASIGLVNCEPIDFGSLSIDSTCVSFASNSGLTLERDTVCVEFCKSNSECDTLQFPIVIKRANQSRTESLMELEAEESFELCLEMDTLPLPSNWVSIEIADEFYCGEFEDLNTYVELAGLCLLYESSTFSDSDEVCVVLCDDATVCDTVKIPVLVQQDTIQLPFFDDFSQGGPLPNTEKWLTNSVFVNNTLGFQAPSVGVATFDGIDGGGSPYAFGDDFPSDILTSAYIDLSGQSSASLSFYLQPKGCGDKPELTDSLVLQFKNELDQWIEIAAFPGLPQTVPNDSIPRFVRYSYFNEFTPEFLHSGFQFRFYNKSAGSGNVDNWHLDYVLLDAMNQGAVFEDVAFTQLPDDILHPYSSMPWSHFEGNEADELNRFVKVGIFNNSDEDANAGNSQISLTEISSNTSVFEETLFSGQEANISAGEQRISVYDLDSDNPLVFPNIWTGANYLSQMAGFSGDKFDFELEYTLVSDENTAVGAAANDTVRRVTVFDNYFAYDDGSAESSISAQGPGTQVAVKFHANQADSLRAIQLYIPRFTSNVSNQQIKLNVWIGELDDEPEYSLSTQPLYADEVADTLQGFTTYRFQDAAGNLEALALPVGDFYVGWQQVSNNFQDAMPVGLDKNNLLDESILFGNLGDNIWEGLDFISGALMIRPVVGSEIPPNTSTESIDKKQSSIVFYPNPSAGLFTIRLENGAYSNFEVSIFSSTGQLLNQQLLQPELDLSSFPDGLYFTKIRDLKSNIVHHQKLMLAR